MKVEKSRQLTFADVILILAKYTKIIVITPTILCLIMIYYTLFVAVPVYESVGKISSSTSTQDQGMIGNLASQYGFKVNSGNQTWVYPEIIKSKNVLHAMIERKFDTREFGPEKSLLQILTYGNHSPSHGMDTLRILATNTLIDMIELDFTPSGIYTVSISTIEPELSVDLLNSLFEEINLHQKKWNKEKTSEARKFIQERINETKNELELAEENLKKFRDRNRRIENSPNLQLERERLSREVVVLTGVFTTLKQQLENTKIEEVRDSNYLVVIDPPVKSLYPTFPKKKQMVILTGIIGLAFGMLLAFLIEYVKNIRKEERDKYNNAGKLILNNIFKIISKETKS